MSASGSRVERLKRLLAVTREERQAAKSLDWKALQEATQAKAELLKALEADQEPLSEEEGALAAAVRRETRRNAYLISFALEWVQDSLDIVRGRPEPPAYGYGGNMIERRGGGNLVCGKV